MAFHLEDSEKSPNVKVTLEEGDDGGEVYVIGTDEYGYAYNFAVLSTKSDAKGNEILTVSLVKSGCNSLNITIKAAQ